MYDIHERNKQSATPKAKRIETVVLKEENIGEHMSLDEKYLGGEFYTILSNKITGKIAIMTKTLKYKFLAKIFSEIKSKTRYKVKTISKDCSETYDLLSRSIFFHAQRVIDKFHVLKMGFQSLQDIRVRYRQQILKEEREKRELHKEETARLRDEAKRNKMAFQIIPPPKEKKFSNGETKKEIIARSKYALFKFEKDWAESQRERMKILFHEFPETKKAYELICGFRQFYEIPPKNNRKLASIELEKWFYQVGAEEISEIQNFASTVKNHCAEILNYFEEGHTNAFAESLNAKLQRFLINNYGIHNRDFFHFRIQKIFS
jgi:transposase